MPQLQTQEQRQEQRQLQRLTQQQLLQVRLLEMPLTEFEESVATEITENPALEPVGNEQSDDTAANTAETYEEATEREERQDALDRALEGIGRDDEMPVATGWNNNASADYEEMVYGDTVSFYDKLKEQILEHDVTPQQRDILDYLIGSLDDGGYLRKSTQQISDELAIYHGIDVTEQAIDDVLHILQSFDPPGIGAQSLKECLLLQVERRPESRTKDLMKRILTQHFEAFTMKHWKRIKTALSLTDNEAEQLQTELRHLNPRPGAAMGETMGRNLQQITPDFIVDTDDDGHVTFTLNNGQVPELVVSSSFVELIDAYKANPRSMNRSDKEALLYAKEKVEKARGYIEAIRQRQRTLTLTMQAIIDWQKKYFQEGDEADLKPMILKDIAEKTGLDISTVSRVSNMKWAQTRWGTFPLRHFFTDSYTTQTGEELSTRRIKVALREIIENEDHQHPLSDEALKAEMDRQGFPVARRTIAKYREQLAIPVARLRKS